MLAILFIGARMRALQIDPKTGNPQPWAQNCFYLCAYSVLIQLVLVFAVPYFLGGESARSVAPGQKLRVLRSSHHLDGFQSELPFPPEL